MALPALVMKAAWLLVKNPKVAALATTSVLAAAAKAGAAWEKSKTKK